MANNYPHSHVQTCSQTGLPLCRRAFNINLALGYTEEFYALKVLAKMHNKSIEQMFEFAYDYIEARDCFKKEWAKMQSAVECPLAEDCAIKQCFPNE